MRVSIIKNVGDGFLIKSIMYLLALLLEVPCILQESMVTSMKPNITSEVDGGDKASPRYERIYVVGFHST